MFHPERFAFPKYYCPPLGLFATRLSTVLGITRSNQHKLKSDTVTHPAGMRLVTVEQSLNPHLRSKSSVGV
jgi:hypothetical protein